MNKTAISWADHTWNPTIGCSRISAGCANCYAARLATERGWTPLPWTAPNAASNIRLRRDKLKEAYKLVAPCRVFVNSMSDLFHEQVPDDFLARAFGVMREASQATFLVLSKRAERLASWTDWPPNVWPGVSVENTRWLSRVDELGKIDAIHRFVSVEPLLEPLAARCDDLLPRLTPVDFVVVGGESGPGYRPMPHSWVWPIRDACFALGKNLWFKQSAAPRTELGTSLRYEDGSYWTIHQFPGELSVPEPAKPHRWSGMA